MYNSLIKILFYFIYINIAVIIWFQFQLKTIWRTHLIIGKKGSGKSTYAAVLMKKYENRYTVEYDRTERNFVRHKFNIYSNMHVSNISDVRYIHNPEDLGKFVPEPYSVLIIDEVNTLPGWDNREFKNMPKDTINYFRYNRQYKVIVYMFTQTFDVDKKIRALTDTMSLCTNFMTVFTLIRKIDKRVTIKESALDADSQIVDDIKFAPWFIPGNVRFIWIPKYTKYFKSYNPPVKPYFPYVIENIPSEHFRLFRKKVKENDSEGKVS